jgi:hypothetical protein
MTERDTVIVNIVAESGEDFVGIWEVFKQVREVMGVADRAAAKDETLRIVRELLEAGLIVAGFPIDLGPDFAPWQLPTDEAISWMRKAWDRLKEDPFTGDICWFITTDKGREWVKNREGR